MKEIRIKKLVLKNFKGIKSFEVEFNGLPTFIHGANATGKTTLVDAFKWLLFGKDSNDRSDFSIKTLAKNGEVYHNLEHSVTAEISVYTEGITQIISLQKVYKEKWTKKRGEHQEIFSGHESLYYFNDLPLPQKDFQEEIKKLLPEDLFKIITDPFYFSEVVKWQDRRNILIDIAGTVSKADVLINNPKLADLRFDFGDDIQKQKASLAAKRKKINDDLKAIPVRIDEAYKTIKTDIDFTKLKEDLANYEKELKVIDDFLSKPGTPNPEIENLRKRSAELDALIRKNEMTYESAQIAKIDKAKELAGVIRDKLYDNDNHKNRLARVLEKINEDILYWNSEIQRLRKDYDLKAMESARSLSDAEMTCPTCKRSFSEEEIGDKRNKLIQEFNLDKAKKLADINAKGKHAKEMLEKTNKELEQTTHDFYSVKKEIEELSSAEINQVGFIAELKSEPLPYPKEHFEAVEERQLIYSKLDELEKHDFDKRDLQGNLLRKGELASIIDYHKLQLNYQSFNESQNNRISELMADEKKLAKQLQEVEHQQYLADEYTREQSSLLDKRINSLFQYVNFKLFDEQVNGGIAETCEVLVEGVPFKDANKAAKVNAGIDVINTLCNYYGVVAPIWIDNRESITNLINTHSQLINLVVDPQFNELTKVEHTILEEKI